MTHEEIIDTVGWMKGELEKHYSQSIEGKDSETERALKYADELLQYLEEDKP